MAQQDYSGIIGMEHHQSERHPHMSNYDRAAQFSPFAALTGYDDCITDPAGKYCPTARGHFYVLSAG